MKFMKLATRIVWAVCALGWGYDVYRVINGEQLDPFIVGVAFSFLALYCLGKVFTDDNPLISVKVTKPESK